MKKLGLVLLTVLTVSIAAYTIFHKRKSSGSGPGSVEGSPEPSRAGYTENLQTDEQHENPKTYSENQVDLAVSHKNEKSREAESGNPKLRRLSLDEEISQVENLYPSILNQKGFTEHEAEVIVRLQIEEMKAIRRDNDSSLVKASKQLGFSEEKKRLLNEAFDDLFIDQIAQFTTSDVAECMSKRLKGISDCTRFVLEDYLKDLSLALESDIFVMSQKVVDLTVAARKRAIDSCHETPERAKYQFRLVFVECDPI